MNHLFFFHWEPRFRFVFGCLCFLIPGVWGCSSSANLPARPGTGSWFVYDPNATTRWSSPENENARPGAGGMENSGAKGHAYDGIEAGGSRTLLDVKGPGLVNRIWITVSDRSPLMLRSLKLEMYWDDEKKPAVSVPFGDFFGVGLGRTATFHNALFSNPEGRSFICFIPMPFRTGARIRVINESQQKLTHIFFDVDFQSVKTWNPDWLYFHAFWNRDTATTLGQDFELLPAVSGKGRFIGVNVGILANPKYGDAWWGEGEVKMYLNGDKALPSLVGTGTEDYIGTGWGQGVFANDYSGCLMADSKNLQWAYYRYHVPDPVFFDSGIRVTIQQIGGNDKEKVIAMQKEHIPLIPVTLDHNGTAFMLYQEKKALNDPTLPDGWANFYRSDDVSATAYFYLASPSSELPVLQPPGVRTYHLTSP